MMSEGPNIARIAAVIGDRGRAQILTALMSGHAWTATELADVAGVSRPTASSHLDKLRQAKLISMESQGRHRYFRIANADVAQLLETMMNAAYRIDAPQFGPGDPDLRKARRCYDHLAGELGVTIYASLERQHLLHSTPQGLTLSDAGWTLFGKLGLTRADVTRGRRVLCRACIDWSERRYHLAGALGAALLNRMLELRWARQDGKSRVVRFSVTGERSLRRHFDTSSSGSTFLHGADGSARAQPSDTSAVQRD